MLSQLKNFILERLFPWRVFSWTTDERLREQLHQFRNCTDEQLIRKHSDLCPFLVQAIAFCHKPQLLSSFETEVERLRRLLIWEISHNPQAQRPEWRRSLTALQRCRAFFAEALPASRFSFAEQNGWSHFELRAPSDVASLLTDVEHLMENGKQDWNDLPYLPDSIRTAIGDPAARIRLCEEAIRNPALRGHLIDLYRGFREAA